MNIIRVAYLLHSSVCAMNGNAQFPDSMEMK